MKRVQKLRRKSSPTRSSKISSSITKPGSKEKAAAGLKTCLGVVVQELTESFKSQLLLREAIPTRSPHVVAVKAMEKTDRKRTTPEEAKQMMENFKKSLIGRQKRSCYVKGTGKKAVAALEKLKRRALQNSAILFRGREFYGPEKARSSGISWVGMNGTDTICVVSMTEPTHKRSGGRDQLPASTFLSTAVADMDGDESFSFVDGSLRVPREDHLLSECSFSLAPSGPEISGQECHLVSKAVDFLMEKLKDRSSLSSNEITQIAICALKYLVGPKFKSNEVEARGFGKWRGIKDIMSERRVLDAIKQYETTSVSSI